MEAHGGHGFLLQAVIYLAAAVIAVPLFQRLKLGSIIGYLVAGILIGPSVLGLIDDTVSTLRFAEFGIVLLLFVIGLELRPQRLWQLRRAIFGLGSVLMLATAPVLGLGLAWLLDLGWKAGLLMGLAFAISCTALSLQTLKEAGELNTPKGETTFSVLLFQDLTIIPLLALAAVLAGAAGEPGQGWRTALALLGAVGGVVLLGRFGLTPLFRLLAKANAREVLAAAALLVVAGTAAVFEAIGLSMALGAFLAGVMLADSEFRHQLEADIEPFRGLLMGLFFIAVGMGLDLAVVAAQWPLVVGGVALVMVAKALLQVPVLRLFGSAATPARDISVLTAQAGEFTFVLISVAAASMLLNTTAGNVLSAIATVSIALTPIVVALNARLLRPGVSTDDLDKAEQAARQRVIVAGYGRVGQVVGQMLRARGLEPTLIDLKPEQIRMTRRFGVHVFFGDGRRLDVLRAAGAEEASLLVLAIDGPAVTAGSLAAIRAAFPNLKIAVRAFDRRHVMELAKAEADAVVRETFDGAVALGREALRLQDVPELTIEAIEQEYRRRDAERLALQSESGDLMAGRDLFFSPESAPFAPAAFDFGPTDLPGDPANNASSAARNQDFVERDGAGDLRAPGLIERAQRDGAAGPVDVQR